MEDVFKALSDPTRREILDRLFRRDGQSLTELEQGLGLTRFGVMRHTGVLEDAGLVVTRKVGRQRLHYLNPVPIRLIHDRWINKYTEFWAGALTGLKNLMEQGDQMTQPSHVYQVYIQTTAEKLWQAITDPELTQKYYYGTAVKSEWRAGSPLTYAYPDGTLAADGEVIEAVAPTRLVMTFQARWDPDLAKEPPFRMTWEIEQAGAACRLTVTIDGFVAGSKMLEQAQGGLPMILSGLKTLLETGEPLRVG
jgi:DNA-binding transcriptional ArsR family regulator/uncharacterized protein YndB with AHSA1/START domain